MPTKYETTQTICKMFQLHQTKPDEKLSPATESDPSRLSEILVEQRSI